jgi:hypothetical protein
MKRILLILLLFPLITKAETFDPKNTYVLIAGVLKWQDKNCLSPFSDVNRKDWELKDQLIKMGVPTTNIISLTDDKATLAGIQNAFTELSKKCTDKSTFIFYYAGHGIKKERDYYFANYDIDCGKCKKTGFGLSYLSTELLSKNKSKTFMFWADCCYSGALLEQGKKVKEAGRNCLVFSSATASNTSTGNWTFTQTLLDCFRSTTRTINSSYIRAEIANAMKYREHQLSGYYSSLTTEFAFSGMRAVKIPTEKRLNDDTRFYTFEYAYGMHEKNWKPVRILGNKEWKTFTARFYFYSDYLDLELPKAKLKKVYFVKHKKNDKVKVTWENKKYDALILDAVDDFYYIKYDGYDDSYNEWVMYDKIHTGFEEKVQIEENGSWYPGEILDVNEGKYFVSYDNYDFSWHEWVGSDRIKK